MSQCVFVRRDRILALPKSFVVVGWWRLWCAVLYVDVDDVRIFVTRRLTWAEGCSRIVFFGLTTDCATLAGELPHLKPDPPEPLLRDGAVGSCVRGGRE